MMKRIKEAVIICLITIALLLVMEGSARLVGYQPAGSIISPWMEFDPLLLWKGRPESYGTKGSRFSPTISFRHNSLGFRMPEISEEKPEGTLRVVVMGDSNIWGFGVEQAQTACSRLQAMFDERGEGERRVEIVNAGMIGYSSYQGVTLLENKILSLKPDLVIASYSYNDRRFVKTIHHCDGQDYFYKTAWSARWQERIFGYSALAAAVTAPFKKEQSTIFKEACPRVLPGKYEIHFKQMNGLCVSRGVPFSILALPDNFVETTRLYSVKEKMENDDYGGAASMLAEIITQPRLAESAVAPYLLMQLLYENPDESVKGLGIEIGDKKINEVVESIRSQVDAMQLKIDSVMGMTPVRPDWEYYEILKKVKEGFDAGFIDFYSKVRAVDEAERAQLFFPTDPCHLNARGQRMLADELYAHICERFPELQRSLN